MQGLDFEFKVLSNIGFTEYHLACDLNIHNSYLPVFGVHEMHGRMHPNYDTRAAM